MYITEFTCISSILSRRSVFVFFIVLVVVLLASPVSAQVFSDGFSDSSLFDQIINVPEDQVLISGSVGGGSETVQVNVNENGAVDVGFRANAGSEVNIFDGTVGDQFEANAGSEVTVSGGSIGRDFTATDSFLNISGGQFEFGFSASGSNVNVLDGDFANFQANDNSVVNISEGDFTGFASPFIINSNSNVTIAGGSFGGFQGLLNINSGSVLNFTGGEWNGGRAELETGGVLNLDGGRILTTLDVFDGTEVNISSGLVRDVDANGGVVNITGGTVLRNSFGVGISASSDAVSYTHLTLPTIYSV